jgi:hypothetical protein
MIGMRMLSLGLGRIWIDPLSILEQAPEKSPPGAALAKRQRKISKTGYPLLGDMR